MEFKEVNSTTQKVVSLTIDHLIGRSGTFINYRTEAEYFIDLQTMFDGIVMGGYSSAVKDFASYKYEDDEKMFDMFFDILENEPVPVKEACYSYINETLFITAAKAFNNALTHGEITPEEIQSWNANN